MWYSEWGGTPVRSDLPEFSGACCRLFALSEGFAVTTGQVPGGYWSDPIWPPLLFYSANGTHWRQVELPYNDLYDSDSDEDATTAWVCEVESIGNEIRIAEGRNFSMDGYGPCEETREWTADLDFSNWRLREPES